MGVFDALRDDDEDDNSSSEGNETGDIEIIEKDQVLEQEEDEGWELVNKLQQDDAGGDDEEHCLICSKGFNKKFPSGIIPCSARCNGEFIVHKYCMKVWSKESSSCPLCRSVLIIPEEKLKEQQEYSEGSEDASLQSFVFVEMDAKSRRNRPSVRDSHTNTFKASKQRQYAIDKRNAQRARTKPASFLQEDD